MPSRRVSDRQDNASVSDGQQAVDTFLTSGQPEGVLIPLVPVEPIHPRYTHREGESRLRAALEDDLARMDYRTLARLSWVIGSAAK
jgi:hypothetical protein